MPETHWQSKLSVSTSYIAKEKCTPEESWEHSHKDELPGAFSRSWAIKTDRNWPRNHDHTEKSSDN